MYDADIIESINAEQLVTATDRLLLRGGRPSRYTHQARTLAMASSWAPHSGGRTCASPAPAIAPAPALVGETVVIRRRPAVRAQLLATAIALPALFGLALGLTALL